MSRNYYYPKRIMNSPVHGNTSAKPLRACCSCCPYHGTKAEPEVDNRKIFARDCLPNFRLIRLRHSYWGTHFNAVPKTDWACLLVANATEAYTMRPEYERIYHELEDNTRVD